MIVDKPQLITAMNFNSHMKKMTLVRLLTAVPFVGAVLIVTWLSASTVAPGPGPLLVFAALLWILASTMASIVFWMLTRFLHVSSSAAKQPGKWGMATLTVCLVIIASTVITSWPLHFAHSYSRGALNELAANAKSGHQVTTPQIAGLFTIDEIELEDGLICLWLPTDHYLDRKGFVQGASRKVLWQYQYYQDVVKLNGDWWFVSCDG